MGILLASLAFALIACYQSVKIVDEAKENRQILAAAQKIIPELLRGDPVSDADLARAGSFRPALESLRDLFSSIRADSVALVKKQNSPDLEGMLRPDRLANVASVDRSLAALKDYGQTLVLTQEKIDSDIDAFSRKIDTLDLPEDEMASFKGGAIPGLQKARAAIAEFVGIETNFCSHATAMMNLIKQNQGRFVVRNSQILFARNADAQVYNSVLASLKHDSQEEADWRQGQTAINSKNLDDLKHLSE
jgi:hypothetical protein